MTHNAARRKEERKNFTKEATMAKLVEISARAMIQAKDRVCWGPLQTRNDTKSRTEVYPRNDHVISGDTASE